MSSGQQLQATKTILLIDDNEIDLFINEKVIRARKTGATVIKEQSAKKAIDKFIRAKTISSFPDIIFIDLDMPVLNGFDFMDVFEKLPSHLISKCKVFMLTSSTHEQDIKRAADYKSIIKFLNKPLDLREVEEV